MGHQPRLRRNVIRIALAGATASFLVVTDARAGQDTARIYGRTHDICGRVLPGVRVSIERLPAAGEPTVGFARDTQADGTFDFRDMVPGAYAFSAELAGFVRVTRDLRIAAGDEQQLDLALQVGPDITPVTVSMRIADLLGPGTATVRMRIIETMGSVYVSDVAVEHRVRVTDVIRPYTPPGSRPANQPQLPRDVIRQGAVMRLLQSGAGSVLMENSTVRGTSSPASVGQEYVAILRDSCTGLWATTATFLVGNGRIAVSDDTKRSLQDWQHYDGMRTSDFIEALKELAP